MSVSVHTPSVAELDGVVAAMATWQQDGAGVQLHPGDLGWHWRFGAAPLARSLRVWSSDGEIFGVGFLDEAALIRMAVSPAADRDDQLVRRLVDDLDDPTDGVLPAGEAVVEARAGQALRSTLLRRGWTPDEPWTPLSRDLSRPLEPCPLRIEVAGHELVEDRVAVQRAAFDRSTMTAELWHTMAAGGPYRQARCLVGYDDQGAAVAATTVWSAGRGRPGLIEPLGVHRDHRGRGHGVAITLAAAHALRDMGASSATVATPSSNVPAVATYVAAGLTRAADVADFRRPA